MLSLELTDFLVQLKEGTINNAGGPTKSATVKLYDVTTTEARAFGDNRVKLAFGDGEDNAVEVAVSPGDIDQLESDLAAVRETGLVDGFGSEDA